jgi:hypothetical protein
MKKITAGIAGTAAATTARIVRTFTEYDYSETLGVAHINARIFGAEGGSSDLVTILRACHDPAMVQAMRSGTRA